MSPEIIATICIGVVTVALMWEQNRILQRQNEIFARQEGQGMSTVGNTEKYKRYWPILAMTLLMVLTWAGVGVIYYAFRTPKVAPSPDVPPARITRYMLGITRNPPRRIFVDTTVVGSPIAEKYGNAYSIYVYCLVGSDQIDPGKDSAIDKSKPYDLADRPVDIQVTLGKENTERILKSGLVDIYLLMIPKSVDVSLLPTFDEIYAHGGKLLDHTAMGESAQRLDKWWNGSN